MLILAYDNFIKSQYKPCCVSYKVICWLFFRVLNLKKQSYLNYYLGFKCKKKGGGRNGAN